MEKEQLLVLHSKVLDLLHKSHFQEICEICLKNPNYSPFVSHGIIDPLLVDDSLFEQSLKHPPPIPVLLFLLQPQYMDEIDTKYSVGIFRYYFNCRPEKYPELHASILRLWKKLSQKSTDDDKYTFYCEIYDPVLKALKSRLRLQYWHGELTINSSDLDLLYAIIDVGAMAISVPSFLWTIRMQKLSKYCLKFSDASSIFFKNPLFRPGELWAEPDQTPRMFDRYEEAQKLILAVHLCLQMVFPLCPDEIFCQLGSMLCFLSPEEIGILLSAKEKNVYPPGGVQELLHDVNIKPQDRRMETHPFRGYWADERDSESSYDETEEDDDNNSDDTSVGVYHPWRQHHEVHGPTDNEEEEEEVEEDDDYSNVFHRLFRNDLFYGDEEE